MAIILGDCFIGNFPESQGFGNNPDYYKQFGLAGHEGVDFALPVGTPVIASTDGVIVRDTDDPAIGKNYGINCILWDKTQLCATYYCHLSSNVVSVGQAIVKGQLIGYSGNTGNTTGPHLHFNLCKTDGNGVRLNQDNGYLGFINPDDKRIATWVITNPTQPVTPPPITQPINTDLQSAMTVIQQSFSSLPDGDSAKNGNLEGYARQITSEHLLFPQTQAKANQFDGFVSKWMSAWKLTPLPEGDFHTIEVEMGLLMPTEDALVALRSSVEATLGQVYTDDTALIKALDALVTESKSKDKTILDLQAKIKTLSPQTGVPSQSRLKTAIKNFINQIFKPK